jgi:hydrogenase-4 component B
LPNDFLVLGLAAWLIAALLALTGRWLIVGRSLLGLGGLALLAMIVTTLPAGLAPIHTALGIGPAGAIFQLSPDALWLLGFGLPGAILAGWLGTPGRWQRSWIFGTAASLIGAVGVFGLQDAASFLVAWEIMSLGGAVMILGEDLASETGRPVLFMLGLLEAGFVALVLAFILLAGHAGSLSFADFTAGAAAMPRAEQFFVGLLLLIGFGAKLGLLPFYEWFPGAYGAASGATGALLSGLVLNAAFFALGRGLIYWLPIDQTLPVSVPGIIIVAIAVVSAILTALYALQQDSWRELLSLSSAENGSIAVCLLGMALMFHQDGLMDLAGLAWTVALLHLAGHALAKSAMFLSADGVYRATGDYTLVQRGLLVQSPWIFGLGALFAAMSLAAMPPQAGFVSEWYLFQTFFQGFHLGSLGSRLTAALAGAGLALTAAIAFATFVKVFGIGLLGRGEQRTMAVPIGTAVAVGHPRLTCPRISGWHAGMARSIGARHTGRFCDRGGSENARRLDSRSGNRRADQADRDLRLHLAEQARYRDAAARPPAAWLLAAFDTASPRACTGLVWRTQPGTAACRDHVALVLECLAHVLQLHLPPDHGDRARARARIERPSLFHQEIDFYT